MAENKLIYLKTHVLVFTVKRAESISHGKAQTLFPLT